jgi:putative ABC transport system permease protein
VVPSSDARFGTANHRLDFDESDPRRLDADVSDVRAWFGTVEVIGHRPVPVPGSVETLEFRTQDPHGAYGAPMLRLREGRYPVAAGEVAVTDAVAATFQVRVGGTLTLDGPARAVVGLVENPSDLDDEFALTSPSDSHPPDSVTMLVQPAASGQPPCQEATVADSSRAPPAMQGCCA